MTHRTRKESSSVPVQETLGPDPYPRQPWPASSPLLPGQVSEGQPAWAVKAHLVLQKIIVIFWKVWLAIAILFSYLVAVAMGIHKVLSIPKDKTRERDELKTKVDEIKDAKPKEIEYHKRKLKEQVFFQLCQNNLVFHSR